MCKICKELVECPIGEKRKVVIAKSDMLITDYYGHVNTDDGLTMYINRYESGYVECGMYRRHHDENNVYRSFDIDIRYCPYCGEKLY